MAATNDHFGAESDPAQNGHSVSQPEIALARFTGQVCWDAHVGYEDELGVHFGAKVPVPHPALAHRPRGSWALYSMTSTWVITRSLAYSCAFGEDPADLAVEAAVLKGRSVVRCEVCPRNMALTVVFDDDVGLLIYPTEGQRRDLPVWELFMPNDGLLRGGPNNQVVVDRSDTPISY